MAVPEREGTAALEHKSAIDAGRRRWTVLLVFSGAFLATLDSFIVNIAFDTIQADYSGTPSARLSWILSVYAIVFAALLVPCGRLADRYGRRAMFRAGLAVFAAASALCAVAPSAEVLIGARAVQGVGAAMVLPTTLGLLLAAYPQSQHRRILSWWSAINTVAAASGPPIGGVLVQIDWRWIFLINLPIAIPAVILARRLPDDEPTGEQGLPDFVGSLLLVVGIGAVVAAVSNGAEWGWGSSRLWICVAAGICGALLFVRRCARHPRPVVDLALLRIRQFAASNATIFLFQVGFAGVLLTGPLYLQQVWHYSPVRAGLAYIPGPLIATIVTLLVGRAHASRRVLTVCGFLCTAAASIWWATMLGDTPDWAGRFVLGSVLVGVAGGLAVGSIIGIGTASVPRAQYATGTGILNTSRQIGAAVGVSLVIAAIGLAAGPDGFRHAYLLTASANLLGALVATRLREPAGTPDR